MSHKKRMEQFKELMIFYPDNYDELIQFLEQEEAKEIEKKKENLKR